MAEEIWEFYYGGQVLKVKSSALGEFLRELKTQRTGEKVKGVDKVAHPPRQKR